MDGQCRQEHVQSNTEQCNQTGVRAVVEARRARCNDEANARTGRVNGSSALALPRSAPVLKAARTPQSRANFANFVWSISRTDEVRSPGKRRKATRVAEGRARKAKPKNSVKPQPIAARVTQGYAARSRPMRPITYQALSRYRWTKHGLRRTAYRRHKSCERAPPALGSTWSVYSLPVQYS